MINRFVMFLLLVVGHSAYGFEVVCKDSARCPSAVGAVLRLPSGGCTGFLVAPDVVATNLHCVPTPIRQAQVSCKKQMLFVLPKTNEFAEERLPCAEMISVSGELPPHALTLDYAFFRVERKSVRPAMPIAKDGIADGQSLLVHRMMFQEAGDKAILETIACPAVQKSLLNPFFVHSKSPLVFLTPCPIIEGNSGSPIVDQQGRVRAILNATHRGRIPTDLGFVRKDISERDVSAGSGSNLACVNTDAILGLSGSAAHMAMPRECAVDTRREQDIQAATQKLIDQQIDPLLPLIQKRVEPDVRTLHENTKLTVKWKIEGEQLPIEARRLGSLFRIRWRPECYFPYWEQRDRFPPLRAADLPIEFLHRTWIIQSAVDSAYRFRAQAVELREKAQLSFRGSDQDRGRQLSFELRRSIPGVDQGGELRGPASSPASHGGPSPSAADNSDRGGADNSNRGGLAPKSLFLLSMCEL